MRRRALLLAALLLAGACAVRAQARDPSAAGRPLLDDADGATSAEPDATLDSLDDLDPESMQGLFNWAIEHSDPDKLREMASAAAGASRDVPASGALPAAAKKAPSSSRRADRRAADTPETLAKRKDVKEALDLLRANPTEQDLVKRLTAMYSDPSTSVPDRLLALEELEDLVRPVDVADDLHALGALAPLLFAAVGESSSVPDDVAAAAAGVLAVATSNNAKLASLAMGWRPPSDPAAKALARAEADAAEADDSSPKARAVARANRDAEHGHVDSDARRAAGIPPESTAVAKLAAIASDPTASERRRRKSFAATAAMTRGSFAARRAFFAVGGVETLLAAVSEGAPLELRRRALALCEDFWNLPDVAGGPAEAGYPPGRRNEELALAAVVVPVAADIVGDATLDSDVREKAMRALRAATEKVGGGGGRRIKREGTWYAAEAKKAAARCDAAEALRRAAAAFEADAADASGERGEYMLALAAEAGALAEAMPAPAIGTGGGSAGEL